MGLIDRILGSTPPSTRKPPKQKKSGVHTFTLHAPVCAPARGSIEPMLNQYGIVQRWGAHQHLGSDRRMTTGYVPPNVEAQNQAYSLVQQVDLTVNKAAARWVETILRTQKYCQVVKGSVVDKNAKRWTENRNGRLPKPWIQPGCKPKQNR